MNGKIEDEGFKIDCDLKENENEDEDEDEDGSSKWSVGKKKKRWMFIL